MDNPNSPQPKLPQKASEQVEQLSVQHIAQLMNDAEYGCLVELEEVTLTTNDTEKATSTIADHFDSLVQCASFIRFCSFVRSEDDSGIAELLPHN